MNWVVFSRLFAKMQKEGFIITHGIYSDDGHNTFLERHYKINYGKQKS